MFIYGNITLSTRLEAAWCWNFGACQ